MQIPYMLNGFHPVLPFKENDNESEEDTNDNGLINIDSLNLTNNIETHV